MGTTDPGTREDRACRDAPLDVFFPPETDIAGSRQVIKTYCQQCPVMDMCLDWALEKEQGVGHSGRSGVFGGMTPRQRATEYGRRRKADGKPAVKPITHGTTAGYKAHRRRDEVPCTACTAAQRDAERRRNRERAA